MTEKWIEQRFILYVDKVLANKRSNMTVNNKSMTRMNKFKPAAGFSAVGITGVLKIESIVANNKFTDFMNTIT